MTQAKRHLLSRLDEHTTQAFYCTIVFACLAFAGMLLVPDVHAERMLVLAWVFMLSAIACLIGKLAVELVQEAGQG